MLRFARGSSRRLKEEAGLLLRGRKKRKRRKKKKKKRMRRTRKRRRTRRCRRKEDKKGRWERRSVTHRKCILLVRAINN